MGILKVSKPVSYTYEGLVASRARAIVGKDATNKYLMSRSAHIASEALTSIKIAFSNFYLPNFGGADAGAGAAATITAAIEYNGAFSKVTFAGQSSASIADASLAFSDYISVAIPAGAIFWVRIFWHNTAGTLYNSWQNSFLGEAVTLSATSISDQTMGGTITNSGSFSHPPIAILGMTQNASAIILGDSIANGSPFGADVEDSSSSVSGYNAKVGVIARSLGTVPFVNLSEGGESASTCVSGSIARKLLWSKASHIFCEYAGVDLRNTWTAPQVIAFLQTIYGNFAAWQRIYQTTFTPLDVTSSDGFLTLANQTPGSEDAQRIAFNTSVRAGSVGPSGFVDIASVVESSLNSGKWIVSPSPPYTPDGIHPNLAANILVQNANLLPPIRYP